MGYKLNKLITISLIFSTFYIFIALSYENVRFSESFAWLSFREVDDQAFQASAKKLLDFLMQGSWSEVAGFNDYGYGSLFWLIYSLIISLGYLFDSTFLIIYLPRAASLIFAFMGCYFVYKSVYFYTKNSLLSWCAVALITWTPEFIFASLRFHNHSMLFFLGASAFYFALKGQGYRNSLTAIILASFATGIKANALIILLIVMCIIVVDSFRYFSFRFVVKLGALLLLSLFIMIFSYSPALVIFPNSDIATASIDTLNHYLSASKNCNISSGIFTRASDNLANGLIKHYSGYSSIVLTFLAILSVILSLKSYSRMTQVSSEQGDNYFVYEYLFRYLKLGTLIVLCSMSVLFLSGWVCGGPFSYANYIFPFGFVYVFGVILFDRFKPKILALAVTSTLCVTLYLQADIIGKFLFLYRDKEYSDRYIDAKRRANVLDEVIFNSNSTNLNVLVDYRVNLNVSQFSGRLTRRDFFVDLKLFNENYDYLIFHTENPMFVRMLEPNITAFKDSRHEEDEKLFKNILSGDKFNNNYYQLVYEGEQIYVFKKILYR